MTMYKGRGLKFEHRARHILEDNYGFLVQRGAGSKGPCDLLAIPPKDHPITCPVFIEVKSTKKDRYYSSSNKEQYNNMVDIMKTHRCLSIFMIRWIDYNNKGKTTWECFYPMRDEIFYRGSGYSINDVFKK